ncbi:hypothetical protein BDC45DRAFT_540845 [Circinella umbellata]|nr:hypothetical protein BDC45DRAFT_540845 [Circinella umbellata]
MDPLQDSQESQIPQDNNFTVDNNTNFESFSLSGIQILDLSLPPEILVELQIYIYHEQYRKKIKEKRKELVKRLKEEIRDNNTLREVCRNRRRHKGIIEILAANGLDTKTLTKDTQFQRCLGEEWIFSYKYLYSLSFSYQTFPMTSPFFPKTEPVNFSFYPTLNNDPESPKISEESSSGWDSPIQPYQTIDPADLNNSNGLRLVRNDNGVITYQTFDPDFIPPPLYPEKKEKKIIESSLYFDLVQDLVSNHLVKQQIDQGLEQSRQLLARRIAVRLSPMLAALPTELERQGLIRKYLRLQIHDTYISNDQRLQTLINNQYNSMATTGLHPSYAAQDVHL